MKINEKRILILSVSFPLYLFLLWVIVRPFVATIHLKQINEQNLLSAVSYDSRNATYYYLLGRLYHYRIEGADMAKAVRCYKESLSLNPVQGGCWLDLAKAYQAEGMMADADYALQRSMRLMPQNPAVMWEAGVFYLINGNIGLSLRNLKEFILLRPDRQTDAYDIVWKLSLEPEYILNSLIPDSYPYYKQYLSYLINTNRIESSMALWKRMERFMVEKEIFIKYIDFLIFKRQYAEAERVWKKYVREKFGEQLEGDSPLIWNGSFEYEILNGGFDWKINETKGVDVFLDRDIHLFGGNSLGVSFDGTVNPDITIASQVVRVAPDSKYLLRSNLKTESLTTTNGIFFSVEGHDCRNLYKKSDVITGTNFWKEISIEFEVPAECSAIWVKIRRGKSYKFDNKISGYAWIDAISMDRK